LILGGKRVKRKVYIFKGKGPPKQKIIRFQGALKGSFSGRVHCLNQVFLLPQERKCGHMAVFQRLGGDALEEMVRADWGVRECKPKKRGKPRFSWEEKVQKKGRPKTRN